MAVLSFWHLCLCFLCFICHFYSPFTRKRIVSLYFGREVRTRLGAEFTSRGITITFHQLKEEIKQQKG